MVDVVDNPLLLSLLRDIRREQGEHRTLLLSLVEYVRKMEQRLDGRIAGLDARIVGVRDDLELMMRSELLGKLAHFETRIDERLAELETRA